MDLLCDRNVADKYYRTLRATEWISVRRVGDILPINAADPAIMAYARERGWVVFTADLQFHDGDEMAPRAKRIDSQAVGVGVVFYRQMEDPSPGTVVDALRAIARSYVEYSEIQEYVPGEWV